MKILSYIPAVPSDVQYRYHMQERILFIHFAPNTWQGQEYDDLSTPLSEINPAHLDTDQWCRAALSFGAREVLFVAKHVGGFCWWQTESSDYSVKNTPFRDGRGDVLAELAASCRKFGLNLGVYVYPGDAYFGAFLGGGGITRDPEKQQAYIDAYRIQLSEVLEQYGEMIEVWFDGSNRLPIGDIIERCANQSVIFQSPHATIRWCGTENGATPYPSFSTLDAAALATGLATARHSDPCGNVWADIECDVPLYTHKWFWSSTNEDLRKTVDELMLCYYRSVGRGAVLLLNASPNTDGLIPDGDMIRYREFGEEIAQRFDHPLTGETACYEDGMCITFPCTQSVNHVRLAEDIRYGERVREYTVSVRQNGIWSEIAHGSMIGASRIEVFEDIPVDAIRVNVLQAAGQPMLTQFSVYHVTDVDIGALCEALQSKTDVYDNLWQSCGRYEMGRQMLDLTQYIRFPGEYRIEFCSMNGQPVLVCDAVGYLEGIVAEGIVSMENACTCILNRTAVVEEGCTTALSVTLNVSCDARIMPVTGQG